MEIIVVIGVVVVAALFVVVRATRQVYVMPGHTALIARGTGSVQLLEPGLHRYFDLSGVIRPIEVKLGAQALPPQQLDLISADRFAFRVTVTPIIEVEDARRYVEGIQAMIGIPEMPGIGNWTRTASGSPDRAYPLVAQAVIRAASQRTLEQFLADPNGALNDAIHAIAPALPGARATEVALTAIALPPEVRKMFTEVERAKREGLAGLERARAEQASLRALANAARNLDDNPHLSHLKMLQVMENARGSKTFVLGQPGLSGITGPAISPES